MVDLSIIYSKTGKGLRARNAAVAGISTKQLKVLSFIDGKSKAEQILTQSNEITEKDLAAALSQLETDGFIRPLAKAQSSAEDWALTSNFAPMVVEEFKSIDDIEAETQAKAKLETREAERIAADKAKEKIRWKAEISARKAADAKEKAEAAAKEKARLEQERIAREAALAQKKRDEEQKKRDDEIRAKAKRQAELEEQAKLKAQAEAERKAQEEADKRARAEAKENARRELERINREAAEAQKKAETEAKLKAAEEARLEAERRAKAENEAQLEAARKAKAELKAQQEAEQAKLEAEQARLEKERLKKVDEARLEAERIAKAENEAQLEAARKAKAELKAQEAAEFERTKLAEKQKTDAEAKEAARLEMARVVRKAEDERKSAEAAAKEARQEAKRQIKAEEQARTKAARKAKDEEKQARIDAEAAEKKKIAQQESVQLEMDRLAKEAEEQRQAVIKLEKEAEQEKELAAQQALEKAEQIRAKNEADEKAAIDAKELAKQEMARIAREADDLRSQANNPTLTKPTKSGRFEASRTAKIKKTAQEYQNKVAEKNAKNLAEAQAREAEKRAYIALTEKQSAAKHQEEIKEPIKAKRSSFDLSSLILKCLKWIAKLVKTTLVYGFLLALLLIGILHFINISPLIAPIEKLASDSLGSPVHIEQVRASLWPQPHLVLGNVAIGNTLKATSVQVIPDSATLFDDVKYVKSLTIQGLVIEQNNADESLQAIQNIGKAPSLKIEQLNLSDLSFKLKDLALGPFDGKLALNEANELNYIDLHSVDNTLTAQIKPLGADYAVTLTGTKWALPLNPTIVFDELKANASIHQSQITFSQIDGALFGGNINAKAVLDWSGDWHTTGSFTLINANAPQLLKAFASKASIDGKANLTGDFTSQSAAALTLTNTPTITANIALKNGKINGVDLEHALMTQQNVSLAGGATNFDKLSANLHVKDGQYHYKQIALETSQFHVNGNIEIAQNQAISGRVNAALNAQSRRLQANFGLGGTLDNVKRQ